MSSESTLILYGAVPTFETFMSKWERMMRQFPNLEQYIQPGLNCAYKYYSHMDRTDAYIITICKPLCLSVPNN